MTEMTLLKKDGSTLSYIFLVFRLINKWETILVIILLDSSKRITDLISLVGFTVHLGSGRWRRMNRSQLNGLCKLGLKSIPSRKTYKYR